MNASSSNKVTIHKFFNWTNLIPHVCTKLIVQKNKLDYTHTHKSVNK